MVSDHGDRCLFFNIFPFPVCKAQLIGDWHENRRGALKCSVRLCLNFFFVLSSNRRCEPIVYVYVLCAKDHVQTMYMQRKMHQMKTVQCLPSPVLCLPSSVLCFPSSVLCFPSSVLGFPSSVLCFPSSVLCFPSSVLCLHSSVLWLWTLNPNIFVHFLCSVRH
jgi:hypothetical protein